jgi:hypothetical protein
MIDSLQDINIKSIEVNYDYSKVSGGYFQIEFGSTGSSENSDYKLSFGVFLEWLFQNNKEMFEYAKNHFGHTDKTLSHIVEDLYSIGVDIDDYVHQYFSFIKDTMSPAIMLKLMQFMQFLRKFGESDGDEDQPD